jgi:murein DD-endopeptidase MepM/ murein hydrolase activator NlpD
MPEPPVEPAKPVPVEPAKPVPVEPAKPVPITPAPTTTPSTLGSYGNASIDQWDSAFIAGSEAVRRQKGITVDPRFIKAMMEVESGGNGHYPASRCRGADGYDSVPACGPMQIKQQYHQYRCPTCDFRTVPGQIELATHIIGDTMKARGKDEYDALLSVYFPGADTNGTTQQAYVNKVKSLIHAMRSDKPVPDPKPVDPIRVIVGGDYPPIDYGWRDDVGLPYYAYGVGHGTTKNTQHTGYDVGVPLGTKLYSPVGGVVDCVGGAGTPRWGQGCGAYADTLTGGRGNLTIFGDSGHKLTLGHVNAVLVRPGDRVKAGQQVGTSGGMNGPHVHVEVSEERDGTYWLLDPGPALREAMGGVALPVYAERVPVPQPGEFTVWWRCTANRDGVKVLQRADPHAPEVRWPLKKGEEVEVVYVTRSHVDDAPYAITRLGSRILAAGLDGLPNLDRMLPPVTPVPGHNLNPVITQLESAILALEEMQEGSA